MLWFHSLTLAQFHMFALTIMMAWLGRPKGSKNKKGHSGGGDRKSHFFKAKVAKRLEDKAAKEKKPQDAFERKVSRRKNAPVDALHAPAGRNCLCMNPL